MLICPQCQFENPIANNFCQQCGTSLTHNTCAECGSLVAFDQLKCPECGAVAGVVWWAIIAPKFPIIGTDATKPKPTKSIGTYLDLHRRYQVIAPFPLMSSVSEQQGQVLDCQPFHLSVLESLVIQTLHNDAQTPTDFADLTQQNRWIDAMETLGIPAIAYPYISLNNQFYSALPTIHNAWQADQHILLLLEDRSHYPTLSQHVQDEQPDMPVLQVMQWLYDMIELWQAMAAWNCQQSLVVLNNLRIDVDEQNLCLQRLHFNTAEIPPSLQDLGRVWQVICAGVEKEAAATVAQLLLEIENQTLKTPRDVQERIEAIAQHYQAIATAAQALDDFDGEIKTAPLDNPVPVIQAIDVPPARRRDDRDLDDDDVEADNEDTRDDTQLDSEDMPTIVLPMQLFSLEEVGRTDVGRQRDHNEDYFGIETQLVKLESPSGKTLRARNLYILCDGMGGHAGGEVASAMAVDTIRTFFKDKWQGQDFPGATSLPDVAMMTDAVMQANQALYDLNQENARSGCGRMGTTLVLVVIQDTEVAVAHVGDSRLYRYTRKRGLEQITVDHEVGQREIQRGATPEAAYARPDAYQLTQALGPRDANFVRPDVQFFELAEDMLLLLCSDGLTDNDLLEKHWETHVRPLLSSQANLDQGVNELIDLANQFNGHDNVTAIAIRAKVRPCLEHLR